MKKTEYKVGDIVWGKCDIHQRWPACITEFTSDNKPKAKLHFIGKKSIGMSEYVGNLQPFARFTKSALRNDPEFKSAVQAAIRIHKGESSLEG